MSNLAEALAKADAINFILPQIRGVDIICIAYEFQSGRCYVLNNRICVSNNRFIAGHRNSVAIIAYGVVLYFWRSSAYYNTRVIASRIAAFVVSDNTAGNC